jgi:hypothetical protein
MKKFANKLVKRQAVVGKLANSESSIRVLNLP